MTRREEQLRKALAKREEQLTMTLAALVTAKVTLEWYAAPVAVNGRTIGKGGVKARAALKRIKRKSQRFFK